LPEVFLDKYGKIPHKTASLHNTTFLILRCSETSVSEHFPVLFPKIPWNLPQAISYPGSQAAARQPVGDKDVHSALRAVHGGRPRNFVGTKLRPPDCA
jgi:hypothetical protein